MKTALVALGLLLVAPRVAAQDQPRAGHDIRWWEAAIAVGAVGALSLADRGVNGWVQDQRSTSTDAWARAFRNGGQPEIAFGVPAAIVAAGIVGRRPGVRRSGLRVLSAVLVAGVTTGAIKGAVGRVRPADASDPYLFKPFSHNDAFPSGHATEAFALATSLSEEIHNRWVTAGLLTAASGTAWSRLNDKRHWLSDVVAGATIGITAAKIIEGRWRIFGLGPPRFLLAPSGARLEWRAAF